MRLFKRGDWWYLDISRDQRRSLQTKDEKEAKVRAREIEKLLLEGKLHRLKNLQSVTLGEFRKNYVQNFRAGLANHTRRHDERSLRLLADAIGDNTPLAMISPPQKGNKQSKIDEFKNILTARGVKPESINSYLRHIKKALNNAVDAGILQSYANITMVKTGKKLPRILYPDQVERLLASAQAENAQEWLFYMVCFWTGARRAEVATLDWQRISFDENKITFIGKSGHERTIPLLLPLKSALAPYKRDIGPVFDQHHLDTYTHKFKRRARAIGAGDIHLHNTRHTAATYMLKSGIDIKIVQKILGHASVTTTEIYTAVLADAINREMQKYRIG